MNKMTKYGIKYKGKLLGISISGNGDDIESCNSYEAMLCPYSDEALFLVDTFDAAEKVINDPIKWYNSEASRPQLGGLKANELEVVEVTITF